VVLAGDGRLLDKLKLPELVPVGSRIRSRLVTEYANRDELAAALRHLCEEAGSPKLIAPELLPVLCEHANGNYRALMNLASELLDAALQKDVSQLDEKLFLDVVTPKERPAPKKPQNARAA
jgi:general secretion pathway protein A